MSYLKSELFELAIIMVSFLLMKLIYKELTNLHKVLGLRAINTELEFELVDLIQCACYAAICTNSKRAMMSATLINLFYRLC